MLIKWEFNLLILFKNRKQKIVLFIYITFGRGLVLVTLLSENRNPKAKS